MLAGCLVGLAAAAYETVLLGLAFMLQFSVASGHLTGQEADAAHYRALACVAQAAVWPVGVAAAYIPSRAGQLVAFVGAILFVAAGVTGAAATVLWAGRPWIEQADEFGILALPGVALFAYAGARLKDLPAAWSVRSTGAAVPRPSGAPARSRGSRRRRRDARRRQSAGR